MANAWYNIGAKEMMDGSFDLLTNTIKLTAVTDSYTFNRDEDNMSTAGAQEVTCQGWTAGGYTLASKAITVNDTDDRSEFDCADIAFGTLGPTPNDTLDAYIVYYFDTDWAGSTPIAYIDTVSGTPELPYTTNGGSLTLQISSAGLLHLSTVTL